MRPWTSFVACAAAVALAIPAAQSHAMGPVGSIDGRIVGGEPASISEAPWQVGVLSAGSDPTRERLFCGGSIIDAEWILTSAGCLDPVPLPWPSVNNPEYFTVLSGTSTVASKGVGPGLESAVRTIILHPEYNASTGEHDVALLRLESPLAMSSDRQPIALPTFVDWPTAGMHGLITGWGRTSADPWDLPTQLQKASVEVLGPTGDSRCGESHYVASMMLCAGTPGSEVGPCTSDGGGPLAIQMDGTAYLAGVAGWERECGRVVPYARVSSFVPWIESTMQAAEQSGLGSISVQVDNRLPERPAVCAYAYSPGLPGSGPIVGRCASNGSRVTLPDLLPGDYQVFVVTTGDYPVPSWWSAAGSQSARANAGTAVVSAGATTSLSMSLGIGGVIIAWVGTDILHRDTDVCAYAIPVGSSRYLAYNCTDGWLTEVGLRLAGLPPGQYQVKLADRSGRYPTQWYRGTPGRSGATKVPVTSGALTEISFNAEEPGKRPSRPYALERAPFYPTEQGYGTNFRWEEPIRNGGAYITGYRVTLKRGKKVVREEVTTGFEWYVANLDPGTRYTLEVRVIAANVGPPATLNFTTPGG